MANKWVVSECANGKRTCDNDVIEDVLPQSVTANSVSNSNGVITWAMWKHIAFCDIITGIVGSIKG